MISSKDHLRDILKIIESDKRLELYKYEVAVLQSKIIFIDVIPKTKDSLSINTHLFNVCHSTIMIANSATTEAKQHQHIQWVRRSSTIVQQLYSLQMQSPTSTQALCKSLSQQYGLESTKDVKLDVVDTLKKKRQVEIIKTGWPHGITIQVSYLPTCKSWIVSDGTRSRLIEDITSVEKEAKEIYDSLDDIAHFWMRFLQKLGERSKTKSELSSITIMGKIIRNHKQLIFYTAVNNKTGVQLDPFEARERLQRLGLKYVPIKSLGMFSTQQGILNSLTNSLNSIRCEFCQSNNYMNGRSKIYFVLNDGTFLGGVNISTAEDILLRQMKKILQFTNKFEEKMLQFKEILGKVRTKLPYPQISYQKLFQNSYKLLGLLNLDPAEIQTKWYQLIKLCLYMITKRIPFQKYAKICFQKKTLDLINDIPLQEFGPIQSKIVLIYYFAHPSLKLKYQIADCLKQSFQVIDTNLTILDSAINKMEDIKQIILQQKVKHNYFILSNFPIKQLKRLQLTLGASSRDTYHKLIVLSESFKGETLLNQNTYPFSWTSIVDSYLQAFIKIKHANKVQQKIVQLSKVTEEIKYFKNYDVIKLKNRLSINLHDFSEGKQIKSIIENILISNQRNLYLRLLVLVQKYKYSVKQQKQLDTIVTNILKKSYSSIRTICIKTQ